MPSKRSQIGNRIDNNNYDVKIVIFSEYRCNFLHDRKMVCFFFFNYDNLKQGLKKILHFAAISEYVVLSVKPPVLVVPFFFRFVPKQKDTKLKQGKNYFMDGGYNNSNERESR